MKKTAIDRAIERLEATREGLDLALAVLQESRHHPARVVTRPRVVVKTPRDVETAGNTIG